MNPTKNKSDFYSENELQIITNQWLKDKKRIEDEYWNSYPYDRDKEYERCLHNSNLRILFRHAARLFREGLVEGELFLYPNEEELISKVYNGILKNGYYSRSKQEEKKVRAHFGKAVSRQSYRQFKRR